MQLTERTLEPITRAADPASTLLAFTAPARNDYHGARRIDLTNALRVYRPVDSIDGATDATHEPATLCALWTGAPGALVFRHVSAQDAPLLAHYTTAAALVYRDPGSALTGALACYAAAPHPTEAEA